LVKFIHRAWDKHQKQKSGHKIVNQTMKHLIFQKLY